MRMRPSRLPTSASLYSTSKIVTMGDLKPEPLLWHEDFGRRPFDNGRRQFDNERDLKILPHKGALVKHLQKELARLQSELTSSQSPSNHSTIVREKDIQIAKAQRVWCIKPYSMARKLQ